MIVAVGGFGDRVLVHKGGVRAGAGRNGPFGGPPRERVFAGNSLAVRCRLDPVKGGTGGDAAGGKGFEAGRRVRGAGKVRQGPHHGEADGGVTGDEGREGGVKEEALALVGEALGVSDRGKSRKAAAQEVNVGWPRPPVVEKLTTGPLGGFRQAKAVHVVLSNLSAEAPGGRECAACAIHPLGKSGPSTTHTESVKPSRRGDSGRHRDYDRTRVGLSTDQIGNPGPAVLGGGAPHVV